MKTLCFGSRSLWGPVLGLMGLIGLGGCTQDKKAESPAVPLPLPPPDADGSYKLTTEELFAPYKTDGKAADQLLRGKTVVVEGRVVPEYSDIEVDKKRAAEVGKTYPDLFLYAGHKSNGFWVSSDGVVCNFTEADRPFLRKFIKKIREQDRVFVRGTVGRKFGHIFIDHCTLDGLIAPSGDPSPAQPLIATARRSSRGAVPGR